MGQRTDKTGRENLARGKALKHKQDSRRARIAPGTTSAQNNLRQRSESPVRVTCRAPRHSTNQGCQAHPGDQLEKLLKKGLDGTRPKLGITSWHPQRPQEIGIGDQDQVSRHWHQARPGPWQGSLSFAKSGSQPGSRTRSKLKSRGERTLLSSSSQAAPVAAPEQSPEVAETLPRSKTTVHRSEHWGQSKYIWTSEADTSPDAHSQGRWGRQGTQHAEAAPSQNPLPPVPSVSSPGLHPL